MKEKFNEWVDKFNLMINESEKTNYIDLIKELDNIVSCGYNITHSDVYTITKTIFKEKKYYGQEDYISENIQKIVEYIGVCNPKNYDKLIMFFDLLSVEVSRYIESNIFLSQMQNRMDYVQNTTNNFVIENSRINNSLDETNERLRKTNSKLENSTSHYISILSIFAGIIIAFTGGISLLGSAFNSLSQNISEYKLFFMVTLVGFIIYNTIVGLMFMIARLTNRDIGVSCKFSGNDCNYCLYFNRMPKILKPFTVVCQAIVKYTYITFVNIILLYLMYVIGILWLYSPNNNLYFKKIIESDSRNIWMFIILFMPIIICLFAYILVFTIHKVKAFIRKRKYLKMNNL